MKDFKTSVKTKIEKLINISFDLQNGHHIPIIKLTTIKFLCIDPIFAAHLSWFISRKSLYIDGTENIFKKNDNELNHTCEKLLKDSVNEIENYLRNPNSKEAIFNIRNFLTKIDSFKKEYAFHVSPVYVVKDALMVVLLPYESPYFALQVSRCYLENFHYGVLDAESGKRLMEIANFAYDYYFGNYLKNWNK